MSFKIVAWRSSYWALLIAPSTRRACHFFNWSMHSVRKPTRRPGETPTELVDCGVEELLSAFSRGVEWLESFAFFFPLKNGISGDTSRLAYFPDCTRWAQALRDHVQQNMIAMLKNWLRLTRYLKNLTKSTMGSYLQSSLVSGPCSGE